MRIFSVEIYEKERDCSIIYTAEKFKFCDDKLWLYHREIGNIVIKIEQDEKLTLTQNRYKEKE